MDVMGSATTAVSALSLSSKPSKGKITWPEAESLKQNLSLPDSIIYYMAKNPSTPEVYLKLAMTCKYFFEKYPILIVGRVDVGEKIICTNNEYLCIFKNNKCCINVDIDNIKNKIWLTHQLKVIQSTILPAITLLQSKIFLYEDALLNIGWCSIKLEVFKIFASKFQRFDFYNVRVTGDDGNGVMLENILETIPKMKEIEYTFDYLYSSATALTIKNILKLGNLKNLQHFSLSRIPAIIAVKDLDDFIKDHKDTKICFSFEEYFFDGYKNELNRLVDTVIASGVLNRVIYYKGQNYKKLEIMEYGYEY